MPVVFNFGLADENSIGRTPITEEATLELPGPGDMHPECWKTQQFIEIIAVGIKKEQLAVDTIGRVKIVDLYWR